MEKQLSKNYGHKYESREGASGHYTYHYGNGKKELPLDHTAIDHKSDEFAKLHNMYNKMTKYELGQQYKAYEDKYHKEKKENNLNDAKNAMKNMVVIHTILNKSEETMSISKMIEELEKAKYTKREGTPGNYKYTYDNKGNVNKPARTGENVDTRVGEDKKPKKEEKTFDDHMKEADKKPSIHELAKIPLSHINDKNKRSVHVNQIAKEYNLGPQQTKKLHEHISGYSLSLPGHERSKAKIDEIEAKHKNKEMGPRTKSEYNEHKIIVQNKEKDLKYHEDEFNKILSKKTKNEPTKKSFDDFVVNMLKAKNWNK